MSIVIILSYLIYSEYFKEKWILIFYIFLTLSKNKIKMYLFIIKLADSLLAYKDFKTNHEKISPDKPFSHINERQTFIV